jgi:hypothetical protein
VGSEAEGELNIDQGSAGSDCVAIGVELGGGVNVDGTADSKMEKSMSLPQSGWSPDAGRAVSLDIAGIICDESCNDMESRGVVDTDIAGVEVLLSCTLARSSIAGFGPNTSSIAGICTVIGVILSEAASCDLLVFFRRCGPIRS